MTRCRPLRFTLRSSLVVFLFLAVGPCLLTPVADAQTAATAILSGTVLDPNGAAVPAANITLTDTATGVQRTATTNEHGYFTIPLLKPSTYLLQVEHQGFMTAEVKDVVLNVNDQRALKIEMKVGDVKETVNVTGEAPLINESPAVATVVDRQFVENIPLNGRSFQSLITLTPGTVLGLTGGGVANSLAFSTNGQRTTANAFMVDGVSANAGAPFTITLSDYAGGNSPSVTVGGGTQSLASVDAVQEFTIQTSTYAPKFGRQPGAQVSIVTRSGSNQFTGSVFEYFRNEALDANDWFNNKAGLKKAPLRQNDFGGVFGGPLPLPRFGEGGPAFSSGKNRTFFFFSYEGLRLRVPTTTTFTVPSPALRASAAPIVQPIFNAFPLPNGLVSGNSGQFIASYSAPQTTDATSLRIDHNFSDKLTLFGRYADTPSYGESRISSPADFALTKERTRLLTLGTTWLLSSRMTNDLRFNYTRSTGTSESRLDNFGGATPFSISTYLPPFVDTATSLMTASVSGVGSLSIGRGNNNLQRQINVVDNFNITRGHHSWEMGIDYQYLYPHTSPIPYNLTLTVTNAATPRGNYSILATEPATILFHNFSAYGQDTWMVTPRLTLTYGLRWELVPPPSIKNGALPLTLNNPLNPSQVSLAPVGTKAWATTYNNFAPRIGVAYKLSQRKGRENVLRGGFGVFYDLGTANFANYTNSAPYRRTKSLGSAIIPIDPNLLVRPPVSLTTLSSMEVFDQNLKLPYTLQWNVSFEQSFGTNQTITAAYVGAAGRRLLSRDQLLFAPPGPTIFPSTTTTVTLDRNGSRSDYKALQLQYERRLSRGLQGLVSYTLGKSTDTGSGNSTLADGGILTPNYFLGPSSFDVRHVFATAVTYDIPMPIENNFVRAVLGGWSVDPIVRIQSAPPVDIGFTSDLGVGLFVSRPDVVAGQPFYIADPTEPTGRRINPAAFAAPTPGVPGNLLRNVVRGNGSWQADVSLKRRFNLRERMNLQFQTDFFNIFNHPNFGQPSGDFGGRVGTTLIAPSASFGRTTSMLNRSLNGLNALHQIGGPRSIQFGLKLNF